MSEAGAETRSAAGMLASLRELCSLFLAMRDPAAEDLHRLAQVAAEAAELRRAEAALLATQHAERLAAALALAGLSDRFDGSAAGTLSPEAMARIEVLSSQAAQAQALIAAVNEAVQAALQRGDFAGIGAQAEAGQASSEARATAIKGIEALLVTQPAAPDDRRQGVFPPRDVSGYAEALPAQAGNVPPAPAAREEPAPSEAAPHAPAVPEAPPGACPSPAAVPETSVASSDDVATPIAAAAPAAPVVATFSAGVPELLRATAPASETASDPKDARSAALAGPPARIAVPARGEESPIIHSICEALASERLGLAEALCEVAGEEEVPPLLRAAVPLAAMALFADGSGVLDDRVREAAQRAVDTLLITEETPEALLGRALLLPAATNLALLAPGADQTDLLNGLLSDRHEDDLAIAQLPMLRELAQTMQRGRVAGAALMSTSEILASLLTEETWRAEFDAASAATVAWRDTQLARTIKFSGATDVWRELIRTAFGPALDLTRRADASRKADVRRFLAGLNPIKMIRDTELQVRGAMSARRNPIHSDALRRLEEYIAEGVRLFENWISIAERAPNRGDAARSKPVAALRDQVLTRIAKAEAEVATLSGPAGASAPVARRLLARLRNVLQGSAPAGGEPHLDAFLGRDLASLHQLPFLAAWQRQRPAAPELRSALRLLASSSSPPFAEAAQRRIDSGNFVGAALVIDLVGGEEARSSLQRALRNAVERRKGDVIGEIETQRSAVEDAERAGRIEAGDAQERIENLLRTRELIAAALPDTAEELFGDARRSIAETQRKLEAGRAQARERITHRFAQIRVSDEATRERIETLLKAEQFALAEDLVDQLEAGETIEASPPPAVQEAFASFFPDRASRIADWLGRRPAAMQDIAGKGLALPANLLSEDEAPDDLPKLAAAWFDCVRESGRNQLQEALLRLLVALGFTDPRFVSFATPPRRATELRVELRVRPLRDRATAVLPDFGSYANGAYTLLCLWQKRDVEDVTQALAALRDGSQPTIVLFFAPLDNAQRRRLAGLARADRLRTTIVVDEVLALHLGTLQRQRLMALFACALPFTDCRPWTDTGTPAPEMFFGRTRELRAIEERSGDFTHLIYGGRQLGKTALLRHVERAAAEQPDTIARYLSIAELGQQLPHTALWQRLADELARAGMPLQRTAPERSVRAGIKEWLDARPGRRLLLLLDEADAFFEKDREGKFGVTTVLRDLTVETDRRFKPVFAGLRNVQKLARDANSPIAHLGVPLVVGPMLRGEERREAEHLVRWPFAALGYRLDDAVVSRILTFANYYPSLIQVVCQRLLRDLRQRVGGGSGGPPWQVQIDHVEKVLETPELRSAAFERFRITLELDERYTLMTLVVASFSMGEPQLLASGIDRGTLRDLAAAAWPAGFPSSFSDDAFEALLDEMVGLGLLRGVGGSHFALRSANLAHLIGRPGDIRRQIDEFAKRPAPPRHDPLEMRRQIDGRPGLLTTRQEGHLLAPGGVVAILAGAKIAGIGTWRAAIEAACRSNRDERRERVLPRFVAEASSLDAFRKSLADRPRDGFWLHVVPPTVPWDASWVQAAYRQFRAPSRNASPTRVVFVADTQRAAVWVADTERRKVLDAGENAARVIEMTAGPLGPADINQWEGPDKLGQTTAAIFAATGGWDAFLRRLEALPHGGRAAASPEALAERLVRMDAEGIDDFLPLPAFEQVLLALHDCVGARLPAEVVDAATVASYLGAPEADVARELALGELLAVVMRGPNGLTLNPHVALALTTRPVPA